MQKLSLILLFVLFCSYPQKTLREEFEECKEIIPYPSDKPDDCTKYLIHSHDINSETGDIVHYRCCMWFDKYFNHKLIKQEIDEEFDWLNAYEVIV